VTLVAMKTPRGRPLVAILAVAASGALEARARAEGDGPRILDATALAPISATDVEDASEHPPAGPLFTTDVWGGYVIYRAWPTVRVVVDDRHDMYGSEYMKRYLKIVEGNWDWQQKLQATGARSALVSPKSALGSLLRLSPEWRLSYDDGQALLFESIAPTNSPPPLPAK